ncbi:MULTISPECIES: hypothetical protein [Pseudomonas]|uniref:Uncharacterized protein n=1 Tax=Pseudomonas taiwanensis SJ9 TaxID=1388762 RepID=V7D4Z8_9PSED|nr:MULTISPECIES: hypothetical protein [Pseudomonas]AVZ17485.1 hypothetical protein DBA97_03905 [Pseudomonas aeruginosa]ESW36346.1 hypothetical protein O164_30405 [Pseudomonas taiwanensis SJ9]MCM8589396.1 hypothetical protein [Pseudomonas aeruginosa]MCM8673307.1 hypothetical protein [Pseudomonas aeruginosa]MCP2653254.1 hypothetical protein [Pseudomonas aeruginosa]
MRDTAYIFAKEWPVHHNLVALGCAISRCRRIDQFSAWFPGEVSRLVRGFIPHLAMILRNRGEPVT